MNYINNLTDWFLVMNSNPTQNPFESSVLPLQVELSESYKNLT